MTDYNNQTSKQRSQELFKEVVQLKEKLEKSSVPPELQEKAENVLTRLKRMAKYGGYSSEYEKVAHWFDWIVSLPWKKRTEDVLDIQRAEKILDKHHYGMQKVKERILEFISVIKLNREKGRQVHAPILCLVGLVGTGKTTFGYALAEAIGRKFTRIPFGGMGSAADLRGQSKLHPDNEPGWIIKAVKRAESKNPVMLLDEIDRVTEDARADIMGVLIEVLDPSQNQFFTDHYIDHPFDLSEVLFVATCNNTTHISPPVKDRMEIIQMPSYSDEEKIVIGRDYLLPKILKETGLSEENISIDKDLWSKLVRPLGFDAGIRSLERNIEKICRKVARLVVERKGQHYQITEDNIKKFLPMQ